MVAGVRARYLLDMAIYVLHALKRRLAAQVDRPLKVLSGSPPARRLAKSLGGHQPQRADCASMLLSRGLLVPHQRLLVVRRVDPKPEVVHVAEVILAAGVAPLGADLVRRHRPPVVDRHALAPVVDATDELSSLDVALRGGCRTNE